MALVNRTTALFSVATRRLTSLSVRRKNDLKKSMLLKSAICHLVRHHPVDICRTLHTSRSKFSRGNNDDIDDSENDEFESSSYSDLVGSETHGSLQQDYHLDALQIQKVFVVQPIFVSGLHVRSDTRTEFIKEETFGLVKTLGWEIAGSITLPVESSTRMSFFGSGQIERIKELINKVESGEWRQSFGDDEDNDEVTSLSSGVSSPSCHEVTTVFVSTFRLTPVQLSELQRELEKPVIDRFHVVLQIFKNHSSTRESKLQVQLAEIPYLRQRLDGDHELELLMKHSKGRRGEIYFSKHRMDLARREKRLKLAIENLKTHRAQIRKQRKKLNIPTVAIVGYTNAGKTSLIKALTKSDRLQPEDKLFATLDVTVHSLSLPSGVPSLLVDTVGFISDIPTSLIASFNATLEDAIGADLLIHVRDVSNQDHFAQAQNVMETLVRINTPQHLLDDMIVIGNKIDRMDADDWPLIKEDGIFPISCTEGYGLDHLKKRIDSAVLRVLGKEKVVIRIGLGSNEELQWLRKNTSVARWNVKRTCRMSISFGLTSGFLCHYWYIFLDKRVPGKSLSIVARKILYDQILFSPINIVACLAVAGLLEACSRKELIEDIADKGLRLYLAEWFIWPPAQFFNFYFLPTRFRVIYDNTISLGYDMYTSHVKYSSNSSTSSITTYSSGMLTMKPHFNRINCKTFLTAKS